MSAVRRVLILGIVGAAVGVLLALLVHAVKSPHGSSPAQTGLLIGLGATGAVIGALCGAAWDSEHRHRTG
jgi:hypothetical protein